MAILPQERNWAERAEATMTMMLWVSLNNCLKCLNDLLVAWLGLDRLSRI